MPKLQTIYITYIGSFPLTVTVTTMDYRSYKKSLNKAPLMTVTGRGNDPKLILLAQIRMRVHKASLTSNASQDTLVPPRDSQESCSSPKMPYQPKVSKRIKILYLPQQPVLQ